MLLYVTYCTYNILGSYVLPVINGLLLRLYVYDAVGSDLRCRISVLVSVVFLTLCQPCAYHVARLYAFTYMVLLYLCMHVAIVYVHVHRVHCSCYCDYIT